MRIADVKRAHAAAGGHFFDKETMRFFKSVVESRMFKGGYFITSEQYEDDPRHYRVRWFDADDPMMIETIGDQLETREDAVALIRECQRPAF